MTDKNPLDDGYQKYLHTIKLRTMASALNSPCNNPQAQGVPTGLEPMSFMNWLAHRGIKL